MHGKTMFQRIEIPAWLYHAMPWVAGLMGIAYLVLFWPIGILVGVPLLAYADIIINRRRNARK